MPTWQNVMGPCVKLDIDLKHDGKHESDRLTVLDNAPTAEHKFKLLFTGGAAAPPDTPHLSRPGGLRDSHKRPWA